MTFSSTEVYYEDGSGIRLLPAATELHFTQASYFLNYIYENGTIYIGNNNNNNTRRRNRRGREMRRNT